MELLRVHVEDPEPPEMLEGLQLAARPVEGEVEDERLTVPLKPFSEDTVAVKEPVEPELKVTLEGLEDRLKSGAWALKNPVIAWALASLEVRLARFQFVSIVLVSE